MRYSLALLVLCLLICSCERAAPEPLVLSDDEASAVAYLKKDPFMRVASMRRQDDGQIIVCTIQGNKRIYYRIDVTAGDSISERLKLIEPHVVFRENF